jgi:hypothetical protein
MESVGQYLRKHRENKRMSIEEVSRATRVPSSSVERIEADRFDELPGEVFVRVSSSRTRVRSGSLPKKCSPATPPAGARSG